MKSKPFYQISPSLLSAMIFVLIGFQSGQACAGADDEKSKIESILVKQAACWNNKDIEGFMLTYWKSEGLTFSSGGRTTRGWQATIDRYRTKYPPEKMGYLTFDQMETTLLGESAALVLGRWHLKVKEQKQDGNFSLVLKKLKGQWKIIHDHSSLLEKNGEPE